MRGWLVWVALVLGAAVAAGFTPVPAPGLVLHGPRARPVVALTFDADMTEGMLAALARHLVRSYYDPRIVAELERTHTAATVFLTGLWTRRYAGVVRALAGNGSFELANHSEDHAAWEAPCYGLRRVSGVAAKRRELLVAAAEIAAVAGRRPRLFRFPGGCQDAADVALVRRLGELPVQWDVVSGDAWLRTPSQVVRQVLSQVRPGSIVVMHLMGPPVTPTTAAALAVLIPRLRAEGYRFVTVSRLLGLRPPAEAPHGRTRSGSPAVTGTSRPRA